MAVDPPPERRRRQPCMPTTPPPGGAWRARRRGTAPGVCTLFVAIASCWSYPRGVAGVEQCEAEAVPLASCSGPQDPMAHLAVATDPSVYKKSLRPPCGNSTHRGPTLVEVQFKMMTLNDINEKLGHVALNGYLRLWWKDPRLAYNSTAQGGCFDSIELGGNVADSLIWIPDIYVDNVVSMDPATAKLVAIYPDGSVWLSSQHLITVKAAFDLSRLPYDNHTIDIVVASYSQPIKNIRLVAKGGRVGQEVTGVGLLASGISHTVWEFVGSTRKEAYSTAGITQTMDSWDYTSLRLKVNRKPKYFIDQAAYPACVFAMISYAQFWIDTASAPARATLAVIPVLIMRTMYNSLYNNVPQGSQHMWLADFLFFINLLVALAAVEFAVVQFLCQMEKRRAENLKGLTAVRSTAERLIKEANCRGVGLLDFLEKSGPATATGGGVMRRVGTVAGAVFGRVRSDGTRKLSTVAPDQREGEQALNKVVTQDVEDDGLVAPDGTQPPVPVIPSPSLSPAASPRSAAWSEKGEESAPPAGEKQMRKSTTRQATRNMMEAIGSTCGADSAPGSSAPGAFVVKEIDFLFIQVALGIFKSMPGGIKNEMTVSEFRQSLVNFNIYMHFLHASNVVGMFLRDSGISIADTDDAEAQCTLTFSQYTNLLLAIDRYWLDSSTYNPWTIKGFIYGYQSRSPSRVVDAIARFVFPTIFLGTVVYFYAFLDTWKLAVVEGYA